MLKEHFFVTDHHFIFSYGYDGNRCYAVYDREDDKMIAQGKIKNDLIEKEKEANVKDKKRIEIIMEILNKCDENYMNKCFSKEDI